MPSGACALLGGMASFFRLPCGVLWSRAAARWSCPVGTGAGLRPPRLSSFILRSSLSGQSKDGQDQSIDHARADAVDDHWPCDREDLDRRARDKALCLCQVYPKRFFYFPVEIRQEFFFLYYEASSGIHSPIISVRYLLFSPISIRPLSNTRTLSISRLITSGRYSVKA